MNPDNKLLSFIAISLNEAEHLDFWYNNHKGFADEFILCDTGSWDDTKSKAEQLGIPFYPIPWRHNFAEAKNTALRFATGKWIMLASPDYWIHPNNFEPIKMAIQQAPDNIKGFWIQTYSYEQFGKLDEVILTQDIKPENLLKKAHVCLFRNDPRIFFQHRVHENVHQQIEQIFGPGSIGILPFVRYHHCPREVFENKDKLRYYWAIEDLVAVENNYWNWAQHLRQIAYNYELKK